MATNRKPKRIRIWLVLLVALPCAVLVVGGIFGYRLSREFEERAKTYDLRKLREMETASLIYDRRKNILGRIFIQNRQPVGFEDLPQSLKDAVIAAEDNRFYKHNGIDLIGVGRAAMKNYQAHRIRQGAGTLTMQLARNTFDLTVRSMDRKLLETFLAMRIEKEFSKNEIMELYLNRVYYGAGFFGAEAAANGYFGKRAKELTLPESAMLAGLLKSPNTYSPWSDRKLCVEQRDFVLKRMLEMGSITEKQCADAVASDLAVRNRSTVRGDSYALDYIRQQVISDLGFENADSKGYRIYTTIDAELQRVAELALEERIQKIENQPGYDHPTRAAFEVQFDLAEKAGGSAKAPLPAYLQGAAMVLDNDTGGILVLVGGRDFRHSQYNRALSGRRPAGTAFLPIVYAAGFEAGLFPGTTVQDVAIDNRQVMIGGTTGVLGEWGPERNDNRYEGTITAREALVKSKNAASVRFGMQAGLEKVIAMARRFGIASQLRPYPATFLGSSEVSLSELTLAFTAFPRGGSRPASPFIIQRIEDTDGRLLHTSPTTRVQVMRPTVAYEVHACLEESLESGTADRAFSYYGLKRLPMGGKTGTAYGFSDVWFIGYNSGITCGVWMGFDAHRTPIYRGAFSNETALPVWVRIMNASLNLFPAKEIKQPQGLGRVEICMGSGALANDQCSVVAVATEGSPGTPGRKQVSTEYVDDVQMPRRKCPIHGPQGLAGAPEVRDLKLPPGEWPRAVPVFDPSTVVPMAPRAPTVLGEDPYGTITPQSYMEKTARIQETLGVVPVAKAVGAEPEVRRATPVGPFDQSLEDPAIKLAPPPPLEFR